jgi:Glycosyl transferase family 2
MKLFGAAMVRNESDIVEAFVRHNLTVLDGLLVVDHGSIDGTSEILEALVREGLPLWVERDERAPQFQSEIITRQVRAAFERGADFVFALDADEFIKAPSRKLLEDALHAVPPGLHAVSHWQTYVPDFAAPAPAHPLGLARRRLAQERHGLHKVIVARHFVAEPSSVVAGGNHLVLPHASDTAPAQPVRHARLSADVVAIAHLPVRGGRQLADKVRIGWLAHLAARRSNPDLAFHWRELYAALSDGRTFTVEQLADIAANYGIPRASWQPASSISLVEDPLPAVAPIRYANLARKDAAERMNTLAQDLAASLDTPAPGPRVP